MRFAKNCFDIGLMVDISAFRLEDWTIGLGLEVDQVIEIEGLRQHRFHVDQAVLKVNVAIDPLPAGPLPGFASFAIRGRRFIVRDGAPVLSENDPAATAGVPDQHGLDVEIVSPSVDDAMRFYTEVLGLEKAGSASVRCGSGIVSFRTGEGPADGALLMGPGIRYLTLQVFDADEACAKVAAGGGRVSRAPVNFGDVARYGFVLDPDGNWIELSARASVIAAYRC